MRDGFRRSAIVLAVIFFLTTAANLRAGIISEADSRTEIADNSSTTSTSAPHGNDAKAVITPQARAEAADIFESRCVTCHGAEGHGDGPAASNLNPKPRDFHNPKWQKSIDDATIARAIVYGGSSVGVSGEMAANPDLENESAVVAALVAHVRGLGK